MHSRLFQPMEGVCLLLSTLLLVKEKGQWTHGSTSTFYNYLHFHTQGSDLLYQLRVGQGMGWIWQKWPSPVQEGVNTVPKLLAVAEKTLSSKIHVFLIWFQAKRLLFQSNNMPWRYKDCLEKAKGCAFGQVSNEFHVSVRKELSIFTSKLSLTD